MKGARQMIRQILDDTMQLHGWQVPRGVLDYETDVLTGKIDQPRWQPEPSLAEQYLTVRTSNEAQALADTCWFACAVFPEYTQRRGLSRSYYIQIGQTCYDRSRQSQTTIMMRDHFEFLAETVYTAIRHCGDFRSMWR